MINSKLYRELKENERLCIEVLENQERIDSEGRYSTVIFVAERTGDDPGPYTYVIEKNDDVRAFSYGVGDVPTKAGWHKDWGPATWSDTNLLNKSSTRGGETMIIYGISCEILPGGIYATGREPGSKARAFGKSYTDARLVSQLVTNCSVALTVNGDQNFRRLGTLGNIPSAGGMFGAGVDHTAVQPLEGGRPTFHFMSIGRPAHDNMLRLPEGFVWQPQGNDDSMLELLVDPTREIVIFSGGTEGEINNANEGAGAGVRGYAYPEVLTAAFRFTLHGWELARRSMNG